MLAFPSLKITPSVTIKRIMFFSLFTIRITTVVFYREAIFLNSVSHLNFTIYYSQNACCVNLALVRFSYLPISKITANNVIVRNTQFALAVFN